MGVRKGVQKGVQMGSRWGPKGVQIEEFAFCTDPTSCPQTLKISQTIWDYAMIAYSHKNWVTRERGGLIERRRVLLNLFPPKRTEERIKDVRAKMFYFIDFLQTSTADR